LEGLENEEFLTEDVLDHDKSMKMLLKDFNINFHEIFKLAMEYYLQGNWEKANEKFQMALKIKENDGPTKAISAFMERLNYKKPDDWKGYRELTEK
jgi:tetratricopeptide (TPR) repeat protein